MSAARTRNRLVTLAAAVAIVLAAGGGWLGRAGAQTDLALPPLDPALTVPRVGDAARALRAGECRTAGATVARLRIAAAQGETAFLDLLDGLYAAACGAPERAVERLSAAGGGGAGEAAADDGAAAAFEDWRLLVLAETAAPSRPALARAAWDRLLAGHPGSPLRPRALAGAARAARAEGDHARALALAERARTEGVGGAPGAALAELAFAAAGELGDAAARAAAARHLLARHPLRAEELGALDALRPPPPVGAAPPSDWGALLGPDELIARAETLAAARRPDAALAALRAVPPGARDLEWQLRAASALTVLGRGREALDLLAPLAPPPGAAGRLAWERAAAARSAAGSPGVSEDARLALSAAAEAHLETAAADRTDRRLAARALGRLADLRWDAGRRPAAVATYVRLREVDPRDLSGAKRLWEAGWQSWTAGDLAAASARWAELAGLYPESSYTRYGRYWTARAAAATGDTERARRLYREVAAGDVADLYGAFAAERLGEPALRRAPLAVDRALPWPDHPDLLRARLLTDLGLDAHAAAEIDALAELAGDASDPSRGRACDALTALVLARRGEPRASIQRIHDAFPVLGGPLQAAVPAAALRLYYPLAHGETVRDAARRQGLDPHLVFAMIRQESAFDVDATSSAGARGLMQLMPATARERAGKMGLPWSAARMAEPAYNVTLGTAYFREVLAMFGGGVELALAGYNGGPYRLRRLWNERPAGTPLDEFLEGLPIAESRTYVKRILMLADGYRQLYPEGETPEPV